MNINGKPPAGIDSDIVPGRPIVSTGPGRPKKPAPRTFDIKRNSGLPFYDGHPEPPPLPSHTHPLPSSPLGHESGPPVTNSDTDPGPDEFGIGIRPVGQNDGGSIMVNVPNILAEGEAEVSADKLNSAQSLLESSIMIYASARAEIEHSQAGSSNQQYDQAQSQLQEAFHGYTTVLAEHILLLNTNNTIDQGAINLKICQALVEIKELLDTAVLTKRIIKHPHLAELSDWFNTSSGNEILASSEALESTRTITRLSTPEPSPPNDSSLTLSRLSISESPVEAQDKMLQDLANTVRIKTIIEISEQLDSKDLHGLTVLIDANRIDSAKAYMVSKIPNFNELKANIKNNTIDEIAKNRLVINNLIKTMKATTIDTL